MAGPYPLATLGPTITAAGISIPSYADIYASLQASSQGIYGSDEYISPDSQDGQMLAVFAKAYNDQNNAIVATYQSFSPSYAQGAMLSSLVRINGLTRDVATNSSVVVTVTGTVGTVINAGVVKDTQNNLWNLPATVTIPLAGSIQVTATAQQVGAINIPINTANIIFTPQLGWTAVNNPSNASVPGAPVETDFALRIRQQQFVQLPASSPLGAIYRGDRRDPWRDSMDRLREQWRDDRHERCPEPLDRRHRTRRRSDADRPDDTADEVRGHGHVWQHARNGE